MLVNGKHYRTVWLDREDKGRVLVINQRLLPFKFEIQALHTVDEVCSVIKDMTIRGAGCIGATAAWGMYLAVVTGSDPEKAAKALIATRPTASNLAWAVRRMLKSCGSLAAAEREAQAISDGDAAACKSIGEAGLEIIKKIAEHKAAAGRAGEPVQDLTHCNAGWLAFVDYGSALSPVYAAREAGIPVHVWVDETRPRNQGAYLTAWELGAAGVPHDLIPDNAGGHLMQHGMVDLVITGADRVTAQGDVANKIGTYLKALAARDNNVPFYVALPSSTFDFSLKDGVKEIPIEERSSSEVRFIAGKAGDGSVTSVQICPDSTPARNWGFDVTPARLITGLITERGVCRADGASIKAMFAENFK
jgi:methylthioribose-1-phosphate isomerase